jgi:DNA-binding CsgD family transcriptional regulator
MPASIDQLVDDLESVLDRLMLPRVTLLGLGMAAGPTVLEYASRHPERTEAIVLTSSYINGAALLSAEERDSLVGYVERFGYPHFRVIDHPDVSIDDQRGVHQLQDDSCTPALQAAVLRLMYAADLESIARAIETRALVLHDRRDPIVPFEQGRCLAAALPNATFVPYDAGTAAPWAIADILVPAIAGFVGRGNARTGAANAVLTCREQDVLRGVSAGRSNRDIAASLHLSEKTVKTHVSNVLRKLGVEGRTEAAVVAVAEGLIET